MRHWIKKAARIFDRSCGSQIAQHRVAGPCCLTHALTMSLALLGAVVHAQAPTPRPAVTPAPAQNWVLPVFTDKEGFRSMTLRGSEVRPMGKQIGVTNLNITIFSGDEKAQVDSVLLSPIALFSPKENRANGEGTVRFIRDDIEVTGVGWAYDHVAKKISLQENVRVTFRSQLKDILK
jgi:hypothetical protein